MSAEDSTEHLLFGGQETGDGDAEALLTQYGIFVGTSEALSSRRQGVNAFFLSVNSLLLAASGLLLRDGGLGNGESAALGLPGVLVLSASGCILCFAWRRMIFSFGQLSKGKFDVIHAMEKRLPARMFAAEWVALGSGEDPKKYRPFTRTERLIPIVFLIVHALLATLVVCSGYELL